MHTPEPRNRDGFTLIELLVVVGIILLMTAIAVPMFAQALRGKAIVYTSRELQSQITAARVWAINHRETVLVRAYTATATPELMPIVICEYESASGSVVEIEEIYPTVLLPSIEFGVSGNGESLAFPDEQSLSSTNPDYKGFLIRPDGTFSIATNDKVASDKLTGDPPAGEITLRQKDGGSRGTVFIAIDLVPNTGRARLSEPWRE